MHSFYNLFIVNKKKMVQKAWNAETSWIEPLYCIKMNIWTKFHTTFANKIKLQNGLTWYWMRASGLILLCRFVLFVKCTFDVFGIFWNADVRTRDVKMSTERKDDRYVIYWVTLTVNFNLVLIQKLCIKKSLNQF